MSLQVFCKYARRGPSSRYRFYQFQPHLEKAGLDPSYQALLNDYYFDLLKRKAGKPALARYSLKRYLARARHLFSGPFNHRQPAGWAIEHQLFPYLPAWVERRFLDGGPPFTIEFDDAIYRTRGHHPKIGQLCSRAAAAIVGNETLADYARIFQRRVEVVPTVVDLDKYPLLPPPDGPFTVAWIGLPYNFTYLQQLVEPLSKLRRQRPVKLLVISSQPPPDLDLEFEFVPWSEAGEAEAISRAHAGVMPLDDTPWERGKCGLKLLQYMAAGRPVVASPVGVNRQIVSDGETGYLAADAKDWENALWALLSDEEGAAAMGRAGRKRVEVDYSLATWGPRVADLYKDLFRL